MRVIVIYFLVFINMVSFAQTRDTSFIKVYSGGGFDFSRDVIQSEDSLFVITGSTSSFPSQNADVLIFKVGHYGDLIWSKAYGGSGDDWGNCVTEASDSSLVISGFTNSFGEGGFDFYLLKTDSLGDLLWSKTFGGTNWDKAHAHVIVEENDIVIVGETQSFGNGKKDIMVVRTDSAGNEIWTKFYGGLEDDVAYSIAHDPTDSTIYIAGSTESFGNDSQGYLLKCDYNGDTIFTHVVGGLHNDKFYGTLIVNDEWISSGHFATSSEDWDFWFYGIDKDDETILYNVADDGVDATQKEISYDITLRPIPQEIYFAGETTSYGLAQIDGKPDLFLGNRWNDGSWISYMGNFGEQGIDDARSIKWLKQNGIVAVGNTEFFSDSENGIVLIRIDLAKNSPQCVQCDNIKITSSVDEYIIPGAFRIFPNPFYEHIYLEIEDLNKNTQLYIYQSDGQLIHRQDIGNFKTKIEVEDWEQGIYVMQIVQNNLPSGSYKMIKY